jgi:hypothetical protein
MGDIKKSENKIQNKQYHLEPVQTNDEELQSKKYYKVDFSEIDFVTGQLLNVGLNQGREFLTFSELAKKAPNGLFTASTSVDNITQFKDGSYSTMVRGANGQIQKHAGFVEVEGVVGGVNIANLVSIGMQAMSIVSGMYYLHEIHNQLSNLNSNMEELLNFRNDDHIGKLKAINKVLTEISDKEIIRESDINQLRRQREVANEIFESRFETYSRRKEQILGYEKNMEKQIDQMNKDLVVAFQAKRLELAAEFIEILSLIKFGESSDYINQQIEQFKNNYNDSILTRIELEVLENRDRICERLMQEYSDSRENIEDLDDTLCNIGSVDGFMAALSVSGWIVSWSAKRKQKKIKKVQDYIFEEQTKLSNELCNAVSDYSFERKIDYLTLNRDKELIFIKNNNQVQEIYVPIQV